MSTRWTSAGPRAFTPADGYPALDTTSAKALMQSIDEPRERDLQQLLRQAAKADARRIACCALVGHAAREDDDHPERSSPSPACSPSATGRRSPRPRRRRSRRCAQQMIEQASSRSAHEGRDACGVDFADFDDAGLGSACRSQRPKYSGGTQQPALRSRGPEQLAQGHLPRRHAPRGRPQHGPAPQLPRLVRRDELLPAVLEAAHATADRDPAYAGVNRTDAIARRYTGNAAAPTQAATRATSTARRRGLGRRGRAARPRVPVLVDHGLRRRVQLGPPGPRPLRQGGDEVQLRRMATSRCSPTAKTRPTDALAKIGVAPALPDALGFPSPLDRGQAGAHARSLPRLPGPVRRRRGRASTSARTCPTRDVAHDRRRRRGRPVDYRGRRLAGPRRSCPYYFCSDEFVGNLTCQRFDSGADAYEQATDIISRYQNFYLYQQLQARPHTSTRRPATGPHRGPLLRRRCASSSPGTCCSARTSRLRATNAS